MRVLSYYIFCVLCIIGLLICSINVYFWLHGSKAFDCDDSVLEVTDLCDKLHITYTIYFGANEDYSYQHVWTEIHLPFDKRLTFDWCMVAEVNPKLTIIDVKDKEFIRECVAEDLATK